MVRFPTTCDPIINLLYTLHTIIIYKPVLNQSMERKYGNQVETNSPLSLNVNVLILVSVIVCHQGSFFCCLFQHKFSHEYWFRWPQPKSAHGIIYNYFRL